MILSRTATIAITRRMWIIPPELYPKNPIAHAITSTTATRYKMLPIIFNK
jgi:hypothetical protein